MPDRNHQLPFDRHIHLRNAPRIIGDMLYLPNETAIRVDTITGWSEADDGALDLHLVDGTTIRTARYPGRPTDHTHTLHQRLWEHFTHPADDHGNIPTRHPFD